MQHLAKVNLVAVGAVLFFYLFNIFRIGIEPKISSNVVLKRSEILNCTQLSGTITFHLIIPFIIWGKCLPDYFTCNLYFFNSIKVKN